MKGASAEPCAKTSSEPTRKSTTRIGSNQNFFRSRMNAHSSLTKLLDWLMESPMSKLPVQITGRREVTRGSNSCRSARDQRIAPDRSTDKAHRRDHDEVHHAHEDRGRDLRERQAKCHPSAVDEAKVTGCDEPRDDECRSKGPGHRRYPRVISPPRNPRECDKGRSHGEGELAALSGAQSSWNSVRQSLVSFHVGCAVLSSRNGHSTR